MTSAVWTLLIILAKVGIFASIIASAGALLPYVVIIMAVARLTLDCCLIVFWVRFSGSIRV